MCNCFEFCSFPSISKSNSLSPAYLAAVSVEEGKSVLSAYGTSNTGKYIFPRDISKICGEGGAELVGELTGK